MKKSITVIIMITENKSAVGNILMKTEKQKNYKCMLQTEN